MAGTGPHGNYVTPINTATNRPGKPIKAGNTANGIVITPNGKTVYVVAFGSGTVIPISTATNAALCISDVAAGLRL